MIYTFIANGFEEIEAITPVDVLRRAGIEVNTVGINSNLVKGANGIIVSSDIVMEELDREKIDGIILPGGMPGAENLYKSEKVREAVSYCISNGKLVCAICAAPLVLGRMGLLNKKKACCYPGFEDELHGAQICGDLVCRDENIITAKGPGAAFDFAFKIVETLLGINVCNRIRTAMQCI